MAKKKNKLKELITRLMNKDEDLKVRCDTAKTLGQIGDKSAVPTLIKALKDENKDVRVNAAVALDGVDDKRAISPLIEILKDKDGEVRAWGLRGHWARLATKELFSP